MFNDVKMLTLEANMYHVITIIRLLINNYYILFLTKL